VQERLQQLHGLGWCAVPVELPGGAQERKRQAVACYASQLRALATPGRPGHSDALKGERYWELTRESEQRI
jgi:hypothetical protein